MSRERRVDALVLGGGPAGSTAAIALARSGFEVVLCEAARFPRFHVGESLLPATVPLLRRLGVWDEIDARGFQPKHGAHFAFEPGPLTSSFEFASALGEEGGRALQVPRAEFDEILLRHAAGAGVEIRQGWRAIELIADGNGAVTGAKVRAVPDGPEERLLAGVLIDATGRAALVGKSLGLLRRDPALRQASVFAHFRDVHLALGREGGDILVVGGECAWYWMIPLSTQVTSVGAVFPVATRRELGPGSAEELLERLLAASPEIGKRLQGARRVTPVRAEADFSYRLERMTGDGFVTVGDAAAFLDPVFSTGVHSAVWSGLAAAEACRRPLERRGRVLASDLRTYERRLRRGLDRVRRFILGFYDPAFISVFWADPPIEKLRSAIVSILAGHVFSWSPVTWLADRLFFAAVALERRRIASGRREPPPCGYGLAARDGAG